MELAISAITGDLASRLVSFVMNKYFLNRVCSEEKTKRLRQLLVRVHTVVEEADTRHITSSLILAQLKTVAATMYQGYHVLETVSYRVQTTTSDSSAGAGSSLLFAPPSRSCKTGNVFFSLELQRALENLENVVANMTEFVLLLGGCDRISPKLYDAYLYMDSFMFGRHAEKQELISFLLQEEDTPSPPPGRRPDPAVLAVIGGHGVGKKTLVAHVWNVERVHSRFSSILRLNGDEVLRIADHEKPSGRRTLVVVEFVSDVADDEWTAFSSYFKCMGTGSKVIILCRNKNLERFATVRSIHLRCLPYEEFRYLFKTLTFGASDPVDYPQLAKTVEEFPRLLGGSFISANLLADALRNNLNPHFWLRKLNAIRVSVRKNTSIFGLHPQVLFFRGHPVQFVLYPLHKCPDDVQRRNDLPKMILGELLAGHVTPQEGDYSLVSWQSRLPPYASFAHMVHFAPRCVDDHNPGNKLSRRKRPRLA